MHPAKSVIFFTTATGAGYGLLVALFAYTLLAPTPPGDVFVLSSFAVAFALIAAGLLSSTLHLGHPERAWRALSQWRSSWLSREGVAALVTFIPGLAFAWCWLNLGIDQAWTLISGGLTAVLSLTTVWCTAMIYACLKAIPAWRTPWTLPGYLSLSVMTGAVLLNFMIAVTGTPATKLPVYSSVGFLLFGLLVKGIYWAFLNVAAPKASIQQATGLHASSVRQLDAPHDSANYLMLEMGFRIARKHANTLRKISIVLGFLVPAAVLGTTLVIDLGLGVYPAAIALLSMAIGVVIERWLFFAEAKHVVTLYYGEEKV